jgi:hypothetical protein
MNLSNKVVLVTRRQSRKPVPYEKVTPEYAAVNIVKGIAEGQTYIVPEPMSRQVEQLWSTDNRKLEHVALHLGA